MVAARHTKALQVRSLVTVLPHESALLTLFVPDSVVGMAMLPAVPFHIPHEFLKMLHHIFPNCTIMLTEII